MSTRNQHSHIDGKVKGIGVCERILFHDGDGSSGSGSGSSSRSNGSSSIRKLDQIWCLS